MDFVIALAALCFLMFVAYRGFSVILFAPIAALGAVFLTDPHAVPAAFTSLFMDKMVGFARLYFPVFLLGAVFGKVIETSGFAKSIVHTIISVVGKQQAIMAIVRADDESAYAENQRQYAEELHSARFPVEIRDAFGLS